MASMKNIDDNQEFDDFGIQEEFTEDSNGFDLPTQKVEESSLMGIKMEQSWECDIKVEDERVFMTNPLFVDFGIKEEYEELDIKRELPEDPNDGLIKRRKLQSPKGMTEILDALSDEEENFSDCLSDNESESSDNNATENILESFIWDNGDHFVPRVYNFLDKDSAGIDASFTVNENSPVVDYFLAYFDENIMKLVVDNTNLYYAFCMNYYGVHQTQKAQCWSDTTKEEMYVFFALCLLMPHVKKATIKEYWSTDDLISTSIHTKYMTRDRFLSLLRFIHFADNEGTDETDRLYKIREIVSFFKTKFSNSFHPFQKLVIDESHMLFKGRLAFKHYFPSERHQFGIKIKVICDCETGIVLDFIICTNDESEVTRKDPLGTSGAIVKKLMEKYLGKGHLLYCDNWYNSPALSKYLDSVNTGTCGTLTQSKKNVPNFSNLKNSGDIERKKCGKLLILRWHDKCDVTFITTFHKGEIIDSSKINHRTNEVIKKPDCIIDYTTNMHFVDKVDMQLTALECARKTVKWYKRLFFHIMDIVMLNSYNMYSVKTGNNRMTFKDFHRETVRQLLEKFGTFRNTAPGRSASANFDRLSAVPFMERHFPDHVPATGSKKRGQKRCIVCSSTTRGEKKSTFVTTWCPECQVGLCLGACFRAFHTHKKY